MNPPKAIFSHEIDIHDTTLRDGEQMPGVVFTPDEKILLASKSAEFGCSFIDIMPAVSESEQAVTKRLAEMFPGKISASCRAKPDDIELAARLGVQRVTLFAPLSDVHLRFKLGISREENLQRSLVLIDYARSFGLIVDFAGEDATRADRAYLEEFLGEISGAIDIFYIADTVGCLTPPRAHRLVSELKTVSSCKLGLHVHNDFGLATASTIEGIRAGASVFSGTFAGIGERAGNAPIEEVCASLLYLCGVELGVDYQLISEICSLVEQFSKVNLQAHKPLVGANAFSHESGIHADGVIKEPSTYEPFDPEAIGRRRKFWFGKHSGRGIVKHALESVGVHLPEDELDGFLADIKSRAEHEKRSFSEDELIGMCRRVRV